MNRGVERIPIEAIIVGERRREDDGNIAGLADSIREWGLIHPLTVDQNNHLVAGGRRLKALRRLGYKEIEVRRWENLSQAELRELELEENLQRKDLTAYERSKTTADLAETARLVDLETGEIISGRSDSDRPEARPQNQQRLGSLSRIADRTGIPKTTIIEAKQHVAAADRYPFLQQPGWKQYHALEAAETLDTLPEEQRSAAAILIDQPGIPPQEALPILKNLVAKPASERQQIFDLARSQDKRDRDLALTRAAERPPMPDPRLIKLQQVLRDLRETRNAFPNDPANAAIEAVMSACQAAITFLKEHPHHDEQRAVS